MPDTNYVSFSMPDGDLARLVEKAVPPDGIKVEVKHGFIQCSGPGLIVSEVFIQFSRDVGVGILSAWLYDILKASGKKITQINKDDVPLEKQDIKFCIEQILANQQYRESQRREGQAKKP
jgi:hypothetical protein